MAVRLPLQAKEAAIFASADESVICICLLSAQTGLAELATGA
jgi:hypothetical protein